jgi:hypothetical protein
LRPSLADSKPSHMVAILLSALAMTLIVGVRYLATSGFFAWLTARLHPGLYAKLDTQMRREVYWSLLSAGIYGVPAGRKSTAISMPFRSGTCRYRCCSTSPRMTHGFTGRIG